MTGFSCALCESDELQELGFELSVLNKSLLTLTTHFNSKVIARSAKAWIKEHNMQTMPWPDQLLDLNPTEKLLKIIKLKMENHKLNGFVQKEQDQGSCREHDTQLVVINYVCVFLICDTDICQYCVRACPSRDEQVPDLCSKD